MKILPTVVDQIGRTPLLPIRHIFKKNGVEIWAKAEWFNPGGSVKDRPALNMIVEAEKSRVLTKDKTVIDASSGNTAIAYAMIGAAKGYRVTVCLPENASTERRQILRAYGAELVFTDPLRGTDGAILKVREIVSKDPKKYYYPDQYGNDNNWKAHFKTTAPEIWRQVAGRVTHFVAGVGTTGTLMGVGRRMKKFNRRIQVVSAQPLEELHGIEGLKNLEAVEIVPRIYDPTVPDRTIRIRTDEAYAMSRRLVREEGLFVGQSSGMALAAAVKLADEIKKGVIVTLFADGGEKYLSTRLFQ
ncbi:MAG: cysteine synthase family protein [Nitrospirae bacterium]|nr:cysteine synthase family protein [Nitrospirota bacterium]